MAAIDLLFDVKSNSERLHQLALGSLLIKTEILRKLGFNVGPKNRDDFGWEPKGGKFDLSIELEDDSIIWIEIKIDSYLNNYQKDNQIKFVNQENKNSHLLYLILGFTQQTIDLKALQKELDEKRPETEVVYKVCNSKEFIDCIDKTLKEKQELRDVRDLLISYRDVLLTLDKRGSEYSTKPLLQWGLGEYFGLYKDCKNKIKAMPADSKMGYVPNPGGGFMGCWFNFQQIKSFPESWIYLQFEGFGNTFILCFKVEVLNEQNQSKVRNWAHQRVMECSNKLNVEKVKRPNRFGKGKYMTVALLEDIIPKEGNVDWTLLEKIVEETVEVVNMVSKA